MQNDKKHAGWVGWVEDDGLAKQAANRLVISRGVDHPCGGSWCGGFCVVGAKTKAHLADGLAKGGGLICSGGALAWLRDVLSYIALLSA